MRALIYLLFFTSLFFTSCKKENRSDCFKGTGEIVTEIRELGAFDTIYVQSNISVLITTDTIREIKIQAGENLLPKIITKVENGKLSISNSNRCNFVRSYKNEITVTVTLSSIKGIETDGQGLIKGTNTITGDTIDINIKNAGDVDLKLDVDHVLTHVHGSGDVILSGEAGVHEIHVVGNSFIRCANLATGYTFIYTNTTGQTYVNATKAIGATIAGSGNVYYSGNPAELKSESYSTGQLIEEK